MTKLLPPVSRLCLMHKMRALALAISLLCVTCQTSAQDLAPVPDAKELAEAKKLVEEVYADLLEAKTDEDRAAAARVLNMRAAETDSVPAAKYILYEFARTLAVEAGDTEAAMEAINGLATSFDHPSGEFLDLAAVSLQELSRKVKTTAEHATVAQAGLEVIEQMTSADQHNEAMNLLSRIRNSVQRSRRPELANAYKAMQEELRTIREESERIAGDLEAIKKSPNDPALNLSVGRYFAIYLDDWEAALPLLCQSSDEVWATAAKMDLAGARDTKTQIAIGDRWWSIASDKANFEKQNLAERAKHWYLLALPSSTGIERAMLTKRLAPSGKVKWGDLILQPGIRTMIQADNDEIGVKPGPIAAEASWEFRKNQIDAQQKITLHFEGYLYFPQTKEVGLITQSLFCAFDIEVNGNSVVSGFGKSEVPVKLVKGYNKIRGSIEVSAAKIGNPGQVPSAEIALTELDGEIIVIPANRWFHDATR